MVKIGENSIWKMLTPFFKKKSRQGVRGENFSSLAWKMAFLKLHSGLKWTIQFEKKLTALF